jgi:hypothetical protein
MTIDFNCGNCGCAVRVSDALAGSKGRCPRCDAVIVVPAAGAVAPTARREAPPSLPAVWPDAPPPPRERKLTPALLLFAALTLLSLVAGSVALWWRFGRGEASSSSSSQREAAPLDTVEEQKRRFEKAREELDKALVLPQLERAKEDLARAQARVVAQAADTYRKNHDQYPNDVRVLAQPDPLNDNKPYLSDDAILDLWGKPYSIDPAGPNHKGAQCDVFTVTPQGKVVGNWAR